MDQERKSLEQELAVWKKKAEKEQDAKEKLASDLSLLKSQTSKTNVSESKERELIESKDTVSLVNTAKLTV
jgi:hypothetical protein